jgi:hypothetical protein
MTAPHILHVSFLRDQPAHPGCIEIWAFYSNMQKKLLFWYRPERMSFSADEFVGLDEVQAMYLRSRREQHSLQREVG